jgi:hypothetical protein
MKKILFLLNLFFVSLLLNSLCYLPASLAAESVGRLFTSPIERQNLEYLRQIRKPNAPIAVPEDAPVLPAEPTPIVLPEAVHMQGYVKRNDGKESTVWVNNQMMRENSRNKDVIVGKLPQNGNRIPIKLPANGKNLSIKAGQVYDPETNKLREARSHAAQGDSGKLAGTIND